MFQPSFTNVTLIVKGGSNKEKKNATYFELTNISNFFDFLQEVER